MTPRERHAVRVLLLDESDRVLLVRVVQAGTGRIFWFPPGGGVEGGEDARSAAVREVHEETGLAGLALEAEVWRRRHVFTWRDAQYDQRERWFMARVAHFVPDGRGLTAEEREELGEWRWWAVAEMAAANEHFVPRDLAGLLAALLRDGPPEVPLEVGV